MKACIFQKQEPVNIPQIETARAHRRARAAVRLRDLRPAHALEPAQRRAARTRCPYNGKNVLVVGLGPAGYTLAHYLLNEGFGVVGIDGLKIEPLPGELTGDDRRRRRARSATGYADLPASSTSACSLGFGGVSRVRHHRSLGQELPHAHLPHAARASDCSRIYGGVRFGGTLTDRRRVGARLRPRRHRRRRRAADDHRHQEQPDPRHPQGERLPDGAAAHRRLQEATRSRTCRCGCRRW